MVCAVTVPSWIGDEGGLGLGLGALVGENEGLAVRIKDKKDGDIEDGIKGEINEGIEDGADDWKW